MLLVRNLLNYQQPFFRSSDLKDLLRVNSGSLKWAFLVENLKKKMMMINNNNNNNNSNLGSFFGKGRQYNTQRGRKIIECCRMVLYCPCFMLIFLKIQLNTLIIIYTHTLSFTLQYLHYFIALMMT